MDTWNPAQYAKFAAPRLRPALDLLGRVAVERPAVVFDLGCGAGATTRILRDRWPDADVVGVDSSPGMLAAARAAVPGARFVEADLRAWRAPVPADVIYSNAALQWIDGHDGLLPRLVGMLGPGGTLAVQVPHMGASPYYAAIDAALAEPYWRDRLAHVTRSTATLTAEAYYDILAPLAASLDIWEVVYLQVLEGADPVLEWSKGTGIAPLLAALDGADRTAFADEMRRRFAAAYPPRADGRVLFPFRRLFLIAGR